MPVLQIVRLGHPSLRIKCKPVTSKELKEPHVQRFIDDLIETCKAANGAGIAANQVGINRRIIIVDIRVDNERYPDRGSFPTTVVVNPTVTKRSKETEEDWEGDLSADIRGLVVRPKTCTITGWDRHGDEVRHDLEGFPARVFHHEVDHLDGVFLTDRVKRLETIGFLREWNLYWAGSKKLPPAQPEFFQFPKPD